MLTHPPPSSCRHPTWAEQLVAFAPDLRKFACSLCREHDRADDLVQATFLRAWANAHRFEQGSNLGAWLFTILRNHHIGECRKVIRQIEDPEGQYAARLYVMPDQESHLDRQDLTHAISRLSDGQRQALLLVSVQGLSYEDAARACGCPIGTIKSRVQRARVHLATLMSIDVKADLGPDRVMRAALQSSA